MSAQTQAHPAAYRAYRTPLSLLPPFKASSYQRQHQQHYPPTSSSSPAGSVFNTANSTYAYMNPTLPQPAPHFSYQPSPRHGIKRGASDPEDEFERSNHISTQFKKLRLNNNNGQTPRSFVEPPTIQHNAYAHNLQIQSSYQQDASTYSSLHDQPSPVAPQPKPVPTLSADEFMTVDETPHKIFISDLDSEIALIEAAEHASGQLFLPDFEKQIGAIPDHVLRSNHLSHLEHGESSKVNDQALVLYKDPISISVPEEEDAVRKAILEARRGIRERMRRDQQRERENSSVDFAAHSSLRGLTDQLLDHTSFTARNHDEMEGFPCMEDGDVMDFD